MVDRPFEGYHNTISVKDYGALGDGSTDDRAAIQSAFDAAYGSSTSPHGTTSAKYTNKRVHFPSGLYMVGGPLYLTNVVGGHISGDGMDSTVIQYNGSLSGNTVAQGNLPSGDWTLVKAITPVIMTQGWAYSRIESIGLNIVGANTVGFYLFWNGTGGAGPTANVFFQVRAFGTNSTDRVTTGFLIGYTGSGAVNGLCSETTFLQCDATWCGYGYRNITSNALNNTFTSCGASQCTTAGFSSTQGSIHVHTASLANNAVDIECDTHATIIDSCRTESANFLNMTNGQGFASVIACEQQAGAGAGYFISLQNSSQAVLDSCTVSDSASGTGMVLGGSGTKVYIRNPDFRNSGYLSSFVGQVMELSIPPGTVSALTTAFPAAAPYKGLRAMVTDATATTFMSTVAGGGSNTVPVVCDGTNWKIG